jgi:hypothetical protein
MFTFLHSCTHYKDDGRGCDYDSWPWKNPICIDENLIRLQCVVAVVKRLKVLATCREIW